MKTPISFARCTYYLNDSSITVDYDLIDIPNNTITLNNIERQEQILKEFRKLISDAIESFGIEDILIKVVNGTDNTKKHYVVLEAYIIEDYPEEEIYY
jgi:hypothetical protein